MNDMQPRVTLSSTEMSYRIAETLENTFNVDIHNASDELIYKTLAILVKERLAEDRKQFMAHCDSAGRKRVYYLCMEFLMGRSLKNNLYNMGLYEPVKKALETFDINLDRLFDQEPDAGLGNGGLGRLGACFLDALANEEIPATGYSICYEYGIFRQKIVDGWQTERPDNWLPGGEVWLRRREDQRVEVHFGGEIKEFWDQDYHHISHTGYNTVYAVPYDMYISGLGHGVSKLRLWKAESPGLDMDLFNSGEYMQAMTQNSMAEIISKVLYPNDNHTEGKRLRLRQQYFLCAASIGDIVAHHLSIYGTLDNLDDKVAIHLNDTHPALAIPELMRVLLDDCGFGWDRAWEITTRVFAYTNHTIMQEALERWNEDLFRQMMPRIYQIVKEINERYCRKVFDRTNGDFNRVARMAVTANHEVRMANLSVIGSHSVNGVSALHSEIIKPDLFNDYYRLTPDKFTNVTNGIAARRWLWQANPRLHALIAERLGPDYIRDFSKLEGLKAYLDDAATLQALGEVKHQNKVEFAAHIAARQGITLDPDSIFDTQVKRLHEYKRQHLNAMHILYDYLRLKDNPNLDILPHTYLFGAKAAPGYFLAKQIIHFIWALGREIDADPAVRGRIKVAFLEDYNVTMAEMLMPASEISQQISLAGTEASGTGNMKLMINGAVTVGTYDGANVEITQRVGRENILLFGKLTEEVDGIRKGGYHPEQFYHSSPAVRAVIDRMRRPIGGVDFTELANHMIQNDQYMALCDFESYLDTMERADRLYRDQAAWNRMSLRNIAEAGYFSADRAIQEYAKNIWKA